jgi:hypothetical protein
MIIKHYSNKGCLEGIYWCVNSTNSLTNWIKSEELYVKFVLLIIPIFVVLITIMFNYHKVLSLKYTLVTFTIHS